MNDLSLADGQTTAIEPAGANMMMFNPGHMAALLQFADLMAKSSVTVPDHLKGKPSDCMAIAMQAAQWGMNPFAVAQKTHIVSGRLGYEAQLVNAVITSSRAIEGVFSYEFKGSGLDLECRVGATPRGGDAIIWGEWLRNGDVTVRNSPLWKVNPKQQLGYLQVKNWARLYCPGAILGVYTEDELPDTPSAPRGPRRKSEGPAPLVERVDSDGVITGGESTPSASAASAPAAAPAPPPAPAAAPKPAAPATSATQGGITGNQVAYLRNKLKATGVAEQSICDRFQVTSIELINVEQFDEVKSELLQMA